jgi:hypothetical protein
MRAKPLRQDGIGATWVVTLACAILLLAQSALALHQIDHAFHPHEDVCELCAIGAGKTPLPALVVGVSTRCLIVRLPSQRSRTLIRDDRIRRAHCPRAPPNPLLIA